MKELAGLGDISGAEDNEDEPSQEVKKPKKGKESGKKSQQSKWEKNVRRRVYDALNVLYAAGVLKKDQKFVSCDPKAILLANRVKDTTSSVCSEAPSTLSKTQSF